MVVKLQRVSWGLNGSVDGVVVKLWGALWG